MRIPPRNGLGIIEWALRYPEAADALIEAVNGLQALEWQVVKPSAQTRSTVLIEGPRAYTLAAPLQFATAIADSTATAASASTQLNLLLAALRTVKMNPAV